MQAKNRKEKIEINYAVELKIEETSLLLTIGEPEELEMEIHSEEHLKDSLQSYLLTNGCSRLIVEEHKQGFYRTIAVFSPSQPQRELRPFKQSEALIFEDILQTLIEDESASGYYHICMGAFLLGFAGNPVDFRIGQLIHWGLNCTHAGMAMGEIDPQTYQSILRKTEQIRQKHSSLPGIRA
jgi:hypothetical protein